MAKILDLLHKLDLMILDGIFQPIADWLQGLTSKNNFFFAECATLLCILIVFYHSAIDGNAIGFDLGDGILIMLHIVSGIYAFKYIERIRSHLPKNSTQSNPARIQVFLLRGIAVAVMVAGLTDWDYALLECILFRIEHLLFLCLAYFISCTPKQSPPLRRKPKFRATKKLVFDPLPNPT